MTYPTGEHEELLRRALRAAADSVEPADDGLERIRARLRPPRPALSAWMMSGTEPAALRLKPTLTWLRLRSGTALGGVRPALRRLRPATTWFRPGDGTPKAHPAWLRPVATVAAFFVIIASGAFAISQLQHDIPQDGVTTGNSQPTSQGHGHGGGLTSHAQKLPLSVVPLVRIGPMLRVWLIHSPRPSHGAPAPAAKASAVPSCAPSATTSPSPSGSGSPTPTPTSPSPTPTPTDTGPSQSPSPSPSDSASPGSSSAPSTMALVVAASSAPSAAPADTPTPAPSSQVTPGTRPC